jgi:hypothetical protein
MVPVYAAKGGNTMRPDQHGFLKAGVLVSALLLPHTLFAADFGVSAQGTFTYKGGDDEAFDLNTMNRGDNPFSAFRFLIASRAVINDNTSLYLEAPIDANSNPSLFLTYLRPFARLTSVAGASWLNLQAGRIPTVFGTFGERSSSTETGLIGTPLLYFYHSAARGDIVPVDNDYFFQPGVRGGGYQMTTYNNRTSFVGMPPIYDACWDVGAEVYGTSSGLQFSMAAVQGTVSRPSIAGSDNNDQKGVIGRAGYEAQSGPLFGLRLGVSGGYGAYLNKSLESDPNFPAGKEAGDFQNTVLGGDLSFARGPWQLFSEVARASYEVPNVHPTLDVTGYYVELVRDFGPTWSVAARQEALYYNNITSSTGVTQTWDYNIQRWEASLSYRFRQNTRLRLGYQSTHLSDAPDLSGHLVAMQLQVWTR